MNSLFSQSNNKPFDARSPSQTDNRLVGSEFLITRITLIDNEHIFIKLPIG